jgi:hypothetical protein
MPAASAAFAGLYTVACTLLLPVRYHLRKMQRRSDAVPLPPWLLRTAAKLRHAVGHHWANTHPDYPWPETIIISQDERVAMLQKLP